MKLSLFEALRIPGGSSERTVRAALRRVVRRMYASTRDTSGDVEEGLRFCNAASSVLLDSSERAHYDGEYANMLSGGTDLRRSHAIESDVSLARSEMPEAPVSASGTTSLRPGLVSLLEIAGGMSQRMDRGWVLVLAAALFAALTLYLSLHLSITQTLQYFILIAGAAALAAAAGVAMHRFISAPKSLDFGAKLRDVPIVKWRRERSVFMGSRLKQEEAAWVYRLRVAETDRSRNQRSCNVSIWLRLAARIIDYGLWGAILYLIFGLIASVVDSAFVMLLTSWWALPIATVVTWIPIEAWFIARYRQTPGKWLLGLRCRPGMTALSSPDTIHESPRYALLRALGVAGFGAGGGLPVLAFLAPLTGLRARSTESETRWDDLGDSVVTAVPISTRQAGMAGAILALLFAGYISAWMPSWRQTGAIAREAAALAPQVSWQQLTSVNPKNWLPKELLQMDTWSAKKAVEKVKDGVTTAADAVNEISAPLIGVAPRSHDQPVQILNDPNAAANASARKARFDSYAAQAKPAMDANNALVAFPICERWAFEDPTSSVAWKCYGLGLQMKGRHGDAIQALRKAQKLDPSDRSMDGPLRISFASLKASGGEPAR